MAERRGFLGSHFDLRGEQLAICDRGVTVSDEVLLGQPARVEVPPTPQRGHRVAADRPQLAAELAGEAWKDRAS